MWQWPAAQRACLDVQYDPPGCGAQVQALERRVPQVIPLQLLLGEEGRKGEGKRQSRWAHAGATVADPFMPLPPPAHQLLSLLLRYHTTLKQSNQAWRRCAPCLAAGAPLRAHSRRGSPAAASCRGGQGANATLRKGLALVPAASSKAPRRRYRHRHLWGCRMGSSRPGASSPAIASRSPLLTAGRWNRLFSVCRRHCCSRCRSCRRSSRAELRR